MLDIKKNDILIEKGEIPNKFYYIVEGEIDNTKKTIKEGNFFGVIQFFTQSEMSNKYKAKKNSKILEFASIEEIDEKVMLSFLKYISSYSNNIIFKNILKKKFPINTLIDNKENFIKGDTLDLDFSNDEELNELLNTFDYFMNDKESEINLPQSFDDYKKELKDAVIELNISKFINYCKKGLYNYETDWDELLEELIDLAITINDRALVLYLLYVSGLKIKDYVKINELIKKNWEFLRFNNNNIWIDYAMRFVNNELLFEEVLKK